MKCILLSVFCFALFCFTANVHGLQFNDCGSKTGKFTKVEVSDCDIEKPSCILKRNTNATISIDFELNEGTSTIVNTVVYGVIMGMDVEFNLPNPNGCIDKGLTCPIESGQTYAYVATLPVLKQYPRVKVGVKWELKDANKENIVCVLIPAKIE